MPSILFFLSGTEALLLKATFSPESLNEVLEERRKSECAYLCNLGVIGEQVKKMKGATPC